MSRYPVQGFKDDEVRTARSAGKAKPAQSCRTFTSGLGFDSICLTVASSATSLSYSFFARHLGQVTIRVVRSSSRIARRIPRSKEPDFERGIGCFQ